MPKASTALLSAILLAVPAAAAFSQDADASLAGLKTLTGQVMVVQGDKDVRGRPDQSERIVEVLRRKGVPVHYLVLRDEGHGFSRNENRLAAYAATDRFLDRYLFGDGSREVVPAR